MQNVAKCLESKLLLLLLPCRDALSGTASYSHDLPNKKSMFHGYFFYLEKLQVSKTHDRNEHMVHFAEDTMVYPNLSQPLAS
jgi:hypothetical protein